MLVLKSNYLWLQKASKFRPRRLTKSIVGFFCLQPNVFSTATIHHNFLQGQCNEVDNLITSISDTSVPWGGVKVSELCCSCMRGKSQELFCMEDAELVAGMMEQQSFNVQSWSRRDFQKQSRDAEGFIIGKKSQTSPPSPHDPLKREATSLGR